MDMENVWKQWARCRGSICITNGMGRNLIFSLFRLSARLYNNTMIFICAWFTENIQD